MGVNFPDVRFIINWGPARSILDQRQEAGRAARDRKRAHVVVIYHRQQVGHCEQQIKEFVHAKGCLRVAAYKSLDDTIQPLFVIPLFLIISLFIDNLAYTGHTICKLPTTSFDSESTKREMHSVGLLL